jgi:hypothetical protein
MHRSANFMSRRRDDRRHRRYRLGPSGCWVSRVTVTRHLERGIVTVLFWPGRPGELVLRVIGRPWSWALVHGDTLTGPHMAAGNR